MGTDCVIAKISAMMYSSVVYLVSSIEGKAYRGNQCDITAAIL